MYKSDKQNTFKIFVKKILNETVFKNSDKKIYILSQEKEKKEFFEKTEISNCSVFINNIENSLDYSEMNNIIFKIKYLAQSHFNNVFFIFTNSSLVFDNFKDYLQNYYYLNQIDNKKKNNNFLEQIFDDDFIRSFHKLYKTISNVLISKKQMILSSISNKYKNTKEAYKVAKKTNIFTSIINYYQLIENFTSHNAITFLKSCLNPNLNHIFFIENNQEKKYLIVEGYTDAHIFNYINLQKQFFDDVISSNGSIYYPFLLQILIKKRNLSKIIFLNDFDGNDSITEIQKAFLQNYKKQKNLNNLFFLNYKDVLKYQDNKIKLILKNKMEITIETILKEVLNINIIEQQKKWINKNELTLMLFNNTDNLKILENFLFCFYSWKE